MLGSHLRVGINKVNVNVKLRNETEEPLYPLM